LGDALGGGRRDSPGEFGGDLYCQRKGSTGALGAIPSGTAWCSLTAGTLYNGIRSEENGPPRGAVRRARMHGDLNSKHAAMPVRAGKRAAGLYTLCVIRRAGGRCGWPLLVPRGPSRRGLGLVGCPWVGDPGHPASKHQIPKSAKLEASDFEAPTIFVAVVVQGPVGGWRPGRGPRPPKLGGRFLGLPAILRPSSPLVMGSGRRGGGASSPSAWGRIGQTQLWETPSMNSPPIGMCPVKHAEWPVCGVINFLRPRVGGGGPAGTMTREVGVPPPGVRGGPKIGVNFPPQLSDEPKGAGGSDRTQPTAPGGSPTL